MLDSARSLASLHYSSLTQLMADVPLPLAWSTPSIVYDVCTIEGLQIELLGLRLAGGAGPSSAVVAAELLGTGTMWRRAYFDLLRQLSVFEADRGPQGSFELKNIDFLNRGIVKRGDVFYENIDPFSWQVSRSNGIAADSLFIDACHKAAFDLWKRDTVLRSWLGGTKPVLYDGKLSQAVEQAAAALSNKYEIKVFSFCPHQHPQYGYQVAGIFCFPLVRDAPFSYGFGSALGLDAAVEDATQDCIQKMGFYWAEGAAQREPRFSPTPHYHRDIFQSAVGMSKVNDWLLGKAADVKLETLQKSSFELDSLNYTDLTPSWLRPKGSVVKAMDHEALPLVFGTNYQQLLPKPWCDVSSDRLVHPVI